MAAYLHPDPKLASDMAHDPRCSPALAPEWVLRKMPKTRIVCGDRDPLYDQAVRFANQLARLDVDVGLKIYEGMPHGFLSFLWPVVGVPEVKACVDDCSEILREMCL
jgi:hormone-sensitive lipase